MPSAAPRRTARPFLKRLFRSLSGSSAARASSGDAPGLVAACQALMSARGEVSGVRMAREIFARYQAFDHEDRERFFSLLAEDFWPDGDQLTAAAEAYAGEPSAATLFALQTAAESPRQELFRRLNIAPGSTPMLVDLRRQLLTMIGDHPEWAGLDADLAHLFRSWFNGGFLTLQRIDWHTSAVILERLIQYESVHQIQGWRDLRRRLADDRRCYAFFHPALPDEPLIFIEIALTRRMSTSVQPLLDPDSPVVDPAGAACATFYSITNCQEGLRGVAFGNLLIKQVVDDLRRTVPRARTFATLSPVPGFRQWLKGAGQTSTGLRKSADLTALEARLDGETGLENLDVPDRLRTEIVQWSVEYLLRAKRGRAPLDAVARFHLANGACLERVNWKGDTSPSGLERSLGLMVNYVYRLDDLERNHEAYATNYRVVASREIERAAGTR